MRRVTIPADIRELARRIVDNPAGTRRVMLNVWLDETIAGGTPLTAPDCEKIQKACADMEAILKRYDAANYHSENGLDAKMERKLTKWLAGKLLLRCSDYIYVTSVKVDRYAVYLMGPVVRMYEKDGVMNTSVAGELKIDSLSMYCFQYHQLDNFRFVTPGEFRKAYGRFREAMKKNMDRLAKFDRLLGN